MNFPHSIESERAVLAAILLRPTVIDRVADVLLPGDFYRSAHRHIYEALLELHRRRDAIDLVTLTEQLTGADVLSAVGGVEYLSDLNEAAVTSHNVDTYAQAVRDKAALRGLMAASIEITEQARAPGCDAQELIHQAESKILDIGLRPSDRTVRPMNEVAGESLARVVRYFEQGGDPAGIRTGFVDLDGLTNGLQRGELSVVAARPSMGKTALALNIADRVAVKDGLPVLLFTMEMSAESCGVRMLAARARVNLAAVRRGEGTPENQYDLTKAAGALADAPLFIDDAGFVSTDEIRSKGRRLRAEKGALGLLIVDYVQLLKPRPGIQSREQQVSDMSRSLKAIAKELAVPVVALSQLNRGVENREDKRPRLADLRESGAIEQDADMIFFIYRDEYYNPNTTESPGIAEIRLAKNRNGPVGNVSLAFNMKYAGFGNLERMRAKG